MTINKLMFVRADLMSMNSTMTMMLVMPTKYLDSMIVSDDDDDRLDQDLDELFELAAVVAVVNV